MKKLLASEDDRCHDLALVRRHQAICGPMSGQLAILSSVSQRWATGQTYIRQPLIPPLDQRMCRVLSQRLVGPTWDKAIQGEWNQDSSSIVYRRYR